MYVTAYALEEPGKEKRRKNAQGKSWKIFLAWLVGS